MNRELNKIDLHIFLFDMSANLSRRLSESNRDSQEDGCEDVGALHDVTSFRC